MREFFLLLIMTSIVAVFAQTPSKKEEEKPAKAPMSKATLDKLDKFDRVLESLNQLELLANQMAQKKYKNCLKAFGSVPFCGCLKDKLPVVVEFPQYIEIITRTKDELKYEQQSKKDKELIDTVVRARETCVGQGY